MRTAEQVARERARHWDDVYTRHDDTQVSWFESDPTCSVEMLDAGGALPDQAVIDVGAGASRLVDVLLARGFTDLTALDVSDGGPARTRARLGAAADRVRWVVTDLLDWAPDRRYDIWHDRAVFHFLTDPADRARYRELLGRALAPGALVVLATFADDGPEQCSGLPTARYDAAALVAEIGSGFEVVTSARVVHPTLWAAVQPFTWLVLRQLPRR